MGFKEALAGIGGKTAKFENVGDFIEGEVVATEIRQATDYNTQQPKFFEDGRPMNDAVITLKTSLRDADDPNDTGERKVFLKAWGDDLKAIKSAIDAAGDDDINVGGLVRVTFSGTVPAKNPRFQPRKMYTVQYKKPASSLGQAAAAQAAPAPVQQAAPVQQQAPVQQAAPAQENPWGDQVPQQGFGAPQAAPAEQAAPAPQQAAASSDFGF